MQNNKTITQLKEFFKIYKIKKSKFKLTKKNIFTFKVIEDERDGIPRSVTVTLNVRTPSEVWKNQRRINYAASCGRERQLY